MATPTNILFGVVLVLLLAWLGCCFVMTVAVPRLRQTQRAPQTPYATANPPLAPSLLRQLMGAPHQTHA